MTDREQLEEKVLVEIVESIIVYRDSTVLAEILTMITDQQLQDSLSET